MENQNKILLDLYSFHKNEIVNKVILELIRLREDQYLLSGEDSGLKNVWEEICVQVQDEYSFYWESYEDTIRNFIEEVISKQHIAIQNLVNQLNAIYSRDDEEDSSFNYMDEFFDLIIENARNYENDRITRYINQEFDEEE